MSPIAHMQFGWWFAHWGDFTRGQRAFIALAGAAPDLDGITFLAGSDLYYRTHHILFHNVAAVIAFALLSAVFWRRPRVMALGVFSFTMHMVEDYLTSAWVQHPWLPFSSAGVNLGDDLPGWLVQGVFQFVAMVFILGMTVWIYRRYGRTPLEILSPALDRLVVNYAVLPWRNACKSCTRRARFRCDQCQQTFCPVHARTRPGLKVLCGDCG